MSSTALELRIYYSAVHLRHMFCVKRQVCFVLKVSVYTEPVIILIVPEFIITIYIYMYICNYFISLSLLLDCKLNKSQGYLFYLESLE